METSIKTTDLDLAANILSKGGLLSNNGPWRIVRSGKKHTVEFAFDKINPDWVEDFRSGKDGKLAFIAARGSLLKIISTLNLTREERRYETGKPDNAVAEPQG